MGKFPEGVGGVNQHLSAVARRLGQIVLFFLSSPLDYEGTKQAAILKTTFCCEYLFAFMERCYP